MRPHLPARFTHHLAEQALKAFSDFALALRGEYIDLLILHLAAPLWPRLPVAVGYTGGARWVAFYVSGEKIRYNDGVSGGTGDTSLFLAYKRHPLIAPSLWGALLGSAEEEARHWLVVDRQQLVLYLAASEDARRFLVEQWPRSPGHPLEYIQEELGRLLDNLKEAASPPDWPAQLAQVLRESRANYRLMQQWLDAWGAMYA